MSQTLPRFHRRQLAAADHQAVEQALAESIPSQQPTGTAGGDGRSLRGIPAIGRGVSGAIAGTAPHRIRTEEP